MEGATYLVRHGFHSSTASHPMPHGWSSELDDQPVRQVVDVAPALADLSLARRVRESVRPLDPVQVAVLEDRAGPARDVVRDLRQPAPPGHVRQAVDRLREPVRRRTPRLADVGEQLDRRQLVELRRDQDRRVLHPATGW